MCEALVAATVDAFGQARHRRQQRRLHLGRDRAQDGRRPVPRDARDPHGRPVPDPQAAAPHFREPAKQEAAEGREVFRKVVNVTSISGTQGNVGQANYSAAKAGLVGLTKTLAREWGPSKVNVNAVAFGFVETRLTAAAGEERDVHERRRRDPARDPREDARDGGADHPARPAGDAGGGRGPDLLPLLALVELRPRPGDHRERRPDDGDDRHEHPARAAAASTGSASRGAEVRYEVTAEAIRAYAAATDEPRLRRRKAACDAGLRDRPGLGGDRAGVEGRSRPTRPASASSTSARTWCCTGRSRPG